MQFVLDEASCLKDFLNNTEGIISRFHEMKNGKCRNVAEIKVCFCSGTTRTGILRWTDVHHPTVFIIFQKNYKFDNFLNTLC